MFPCQIWLAMMFWNGQPQNQISNLGEKNSTYNFDKPKLKNWKTWKTKTFSVLKMGEDGLKPLSKTKPPCLGIKEKP